MRDPLHPNNPTPHDIGLLRHPLPSSKEEGEGGGAADRADPTPKARDLAPPLRDLCATYTLSEIEASSNARTRARADRLAAQIAAFNPEELAAYRERQRAKSRRKYARRQARKAARKL